MASLLRRDFGRTFPKNAPKSALISYSWGFAGRKNTACYIMLFFPARWVDEAVMNFQETEQRNLPVPLIKIFNNPPKTNISPENPWLEDEFSY